MSNKHPPAASSDANATKPALQHNYDADFRVTPDYRASLPDVQNGPSVEIQGAQIPILQVGIAGFRLPLRFLTAENKQLTLEATITGTVSVSADQKGINMSRLMRVFYEFKDRVFTPELLEEILLRYKQEMQCTRAKCVIADDAGQH